MSKIKTAFVSYSRKDNEYLEEFKVHIAGLKRNKLIEDWTDQEITPGKEWKNALKEKLHAADIIFFLVSPDFIASDYIHDVEIKTALERYDKGEVIVVPIVIRPCDFESLQIKRFQALPKDIKPISKWDDKDEAWLNVVEGIKKLLQSGNTISNTKNIELIDIVGEEPVNTFPMSNDFTFDCDLKLILKNVSKNPVNGFAIELIISKALTREPYIGFLDKVAVLSPNEKETFEYTDDERLFPEKEREIKIGNLHVIGKFAKFAFSLTSKINIKIYTDNGKYNFERCVKDLLKRKNRQLELKDFWS